MPTQGNLQSAKASQAQGSGDWAVQECVLISAQLLPRVPTASVHSAEQESEEKHVEGEKAATLP